MAISFFPAMAELMTIMFTRFPVPLRLWIAALIAWNCVFSWMYYDSNPFVAKVILGVFASGGVVMTVIQAHYGFVKLLGLVHTGWLFLVPWIYFTQLDENNDNYNYLVSLMVINSISLVLDIKDVWQYFRGDKKAAFVGEKLIIGWTIEKRKVA
jgi:hypothetical protein